MLRELTESEINNVFGGNANSEKLQWPIHLLHSRK